MSSRCCPRSLPKLLFFILSGKFKRKKKYKIQNRDRRQPSRNVWLVSSETNLLTKHRLPISNDLSPFSFILDALKPGVVLSCNRRFCRQFFTLIEGLQQGVFAIPPSRLPRLLDFRPSPLPGCTASNPPPPLPAPLPRPETPRRMFDEFTPKNRRRNMTTSGDSRRKARSRRGRRRGNLARKDSAPTPSAEKQKEMEIKQTTQDRATVGIPTRSPSLSQTWRTKSRGKGGWGRNGRRTLCTSTYVRAQRGRVISSTLVFSFLA